MSLFVATSTGQDTLLVSTKVGKFNFLPTNDPYYVFFSIVTGIFKHPLQPHNNFYPLKHRFSYLSNLNFGCLVKLWISLNVKSCILVRFSLSVQQNSAFTPFQNKPLCLRVFSTSLLKTLWEKEKLLVTSNFSFFHSVFYPFNPFPNNKF